MKFTCLECPKPTVGRGLCRNHYQRWWKAQGGSAKNAPPVVRDSMANGSVAAFLSHVEKTDHCWIWTGATNGNGYGVLRWRGRDNQRAHRISYVIHLGPIPEGLILRHACDNPPCVRPDHLQPGTNADNVADKVARGRARGSGLFGVRHHQSKLNDEAVRALRRALAGGATVSSQSRLYGVTRYAIRRAASGATWGHVL
jgi:hypothetical protein